MRGLGLAIVQDIIKMHGGRMEIRSAPGEGTKVVLCFPAAGNTGDIK
jgi:signal transduction histidine kinase